MKKGLIICCFPLVGKTYLSNARIGYIDLPSAPFNDLKSYIKVAEYFANEGKTVLLDCSINIRKLLDEHKIPFITVLPYPEDKEVYIERYSSKGENSETFLDKVFDNLCVKTTYDKKVYRITKNQYLNDIIAQIRFEKLNREEI